MTSDWRQSFPALAQDTEVSKLLNQARPAHLPAGATVFHQGDKCGNYILVLEGAVKVFTRAENGREIVLYRLANGDTCVLTTSCLFGNVNYPAEGMTETEVDALLLPAEQFHDAIQQSRVFREFVFSSFSLHLSSLISLVEQVAFGRLDSRLARYLLEHSDSEQRLRATHQQIATELGTAREVVSRQLKELEQQGVVELHRGSIRLLQPNALSALANTH